jgi:hypothetical protein
MNTPCNPSIYLPLFAVYSRFCFLWFTFCGLLPCAAYATPEDQLVRVRYVAFMSLALISCHLSGYLGLGGLVEVFVV